MQLKQNSFSQERCYTLARFENDSFWNSEMDNKLFYEIVDAENGKN